LDEYVYYSTYLVVMCDVVSKYPSTYIYRDTMGYVDVDDGVILFRRGCSFSWCLVCLYILALEY